MHGAYLNCFSYYLSSRLLLTYDVLAKLRDSQLHREGGFRELPHLHEPSVLHSHRAKHEYGNLRRGVGDVIARAGM